MATKRKVIVTCAVTGAIHTPTMSPHLPITPDQIVADALAAAEAGASILPACPGFYHRPESVEDLVRHVVQKIFDRLNLDFPNAIRWNSD